jgi:hypothetical protein
VSSARRHTRSDAVHSITTTIFSAVVITTAHCHDLCGAPPTSPKKFTAISPHRCRRKCRAGTQVDYGRLFPFMRKPGLQGENQKGMTANPLPDAAPPSGARTQIKGSSGFIPTQQRVQAGGSSWAPADVFMEACKKVFRLLLPPLTSFQLLPDPFLLSLPLSAPSESRIRTSALQQPRHGCQAHRGLRNVWDTQTQTHTHTRRGPRNPRHKTRLRALLGP